MSDIFVSYKHAQQHAARQLVSALGGLGWDVWWDWNIPVGNDWKGELDAQLDAAGCVLVLWTAESAQSEWVLYEARHAQQAGKLVQVLLESMQPPSEFGSAQGVDLAGWSYGMAIHRGFDTLRAAIRDLLDRRAPLTTTRSDGLTRTPGESGDVVGRARAGMTFRARPAPVMLLPPPFGDLVDRAAERETINATLAEPRNISLAGEEGIGKSALLQHIGNLDHTERFHGGVAYLTAATLGENDLVQSLHEVFYDVPAGEHPSVVQVRRNLADTTALLMLDDADLQAGELDSLYACAPHSCWVFAARQPAASARRRPVILKGLAVDDGVALFERALSRTLTAAERSDVERIVEDAKGHPARIEQAAGLAAMQGIEPAQAATSPANALQGLDGRSRRVLAALACGGAVALEAEQCAAIAQVKDVDAVLAGLLKRGLVQYAPPGFRLSAGLLPQLEKTPEFLACSGRATGVFTSFAFEARGTPRRVARLAAPMIANMAWAAAHARGVEALQLARAIDAPLANANRWDAWRSMLERAHDIAIGIGDQATAGWSLHQQGTRELLRGNKPAARRLLEEARKVRLQSGDSAGLQVTRANLKMLGWTRWMVLLALFSSVGVTTLGAVVAPRIMDFIRPAQTVTVAPASVDFGTQDLRAVGEPREVRIENLGSRPLEVIEVKAEGPHAAAFTVGTACNGMVVPPGIWCVVHAKFAPDGVGARDATLAIRTRGRDTPYTVALHGAGSAAPIAQLRPEAVDFGDVELGAAAPGRSVTVRNTGSAPLVPTRLAIDGDGAFTVVRDNCQNASVEPDAQCTIDLGFAPREAGSRHATLVMTDNASGSPRALALAGAAHATLKFEVAPGSLSFGRQEVGTQSATKPVRLRNVGTAALDIRQVTADPSGAFPVRGRCDNAALAPGADCVLQLGFAPTAKGNIRGRLTIAHSAGAPGVVELTGEAYGRSILEVTPAQLDFGSVKPGTVAPGQTVTVSSRGSDDVRLEPPRIQGDEGFSLRSQCPQSLGPKQQCVIEVGFRPTSTNKANARLIVAHNADGGPRTVALTAATEAIPPPEIVRFDATPATLQGPGQTQLCFTTRNARQVTITPGDPQSATPNSGCVARALTTTTTYTLVARGEGGATRQSSITVAVSSVPNPPPAIVRFDARPPALKTSGQTQLCFSANNAQQVTILPGGPQPQSPREGCVPRSVLETTTYTVTARGAGGGDQRSVTVRVDKDKLPPPVPPPAIVRFDAAPLRETDQTKLCFAATNAQQVTIQPGSPQPQSPREGCVQRRVSETTTYVVTATGPGGKAQSNLTVRVAKDKPPSIARFDANPATLKARGSTQLCFAASNAQTATIRPGDPQPQSPNEGCVSRSLAVTTTYTLTVTGKGGPPQQRTLTVEVPKSPGPQPGTGDIKVQKSDTVIRKDIQTKKVELEPKKPEAPR